MAQSWEVLEKGETLEGFLCPICMVDLQTPDQLTKHFEESHKDDSEILRSLKDLFGSAIKKIVKDEQTKIHDQTTPLKRRIISPDVIWGPQELGEKRSHMRYFKEIRDVRLEKYSSETNKLLLRLDKLLNDLPSDPISKKAHEQAIVPWIDDKSVNLCPTCAKSFHVARRKHHCRLCGTVMCHDCTMFLSLQDAKKMTNPSSVQDDSAVSPSSSGSPIAGRIVRVGIGLTKLARSPSSGSLNSVLSFMNDPSSADQHFRLCTHCKNLLDSREHLKQSRLTKPIICQFYEKMRCYIEEANQHLAMYNKMCLSLNEGESTYNLQDAQTLRVKIAKLGEYIETISKRIAILGSKDVDNPPRGQELRLQQMVRMGATVFLKEHLLSMPTLPTAQEFEMLKEKREKRIEERIMHERQLEMEERQRERRREQQKKEGRNADIPSSLKNDQMVFDQSQGWGPSGAAPMLATSMDPILEQMNNLRSYIKQARAAHKYDEVATLEYNLKELQSAYFAMKQGSNSDSND